MSSLVSTPTTATSSGDASRGRICTLPSSYITIPYLQASMILKSKAFRPVPNDILVDCAIADSDCENTLSSSSVSDKSSWYTISSIYTTTGAVLTDASTRVAGGNPTRRPPPITKQNLQELDNSLIASATLDWFQTNSNELRDVKNHPGGFSRWWVENAGDVRCCESLNERVETWLEGVGVFMIG